jgi:PAS domain S-box-containing protein
LFAVGCGLVLLPRWGYALDPAKSLTQYNCQNWTRQSGLPGNGINAITQTKDGYMWFGTQKGLVRFDGSEFKLFPLPGRPEFRRQSIAALARSEAGGLWFGINNSAFGHFDGETQFTTIDAPPWVNPMMNVLVVLETRDHALWVAGDGGVAYFPNGTTNINLVSEAVGPISAIHEAANGRIWLGTADRGVYLWSEGRLTPLPDPNLSGVLIQALAEDNAGQLWVGTSTRVFCYDTNQQAISQPTPPTGVRTLLVDRRGSVWVGTTGDGLGRYGNRQLSMMRRPDGLVNDYVTALFEDREGSLWVGTREGLSHITDVKLPILGVAEGLPTYMVHGVAPARDGGLWAATSVGISRLRDNTVTNWGNEAGLTNAYIKRVFESRSGDLYAISGDRMVEILAQGHVVARQGNGTWPVALAEDAEGVVVSVGGDLFRVDRERFTPYPFQESSPQFFWVRGLAVAKDGALLVASVNGIFRIQDGKFTRWFADNGLSDSSAHCVLESPDGAIWAGLSTGIARIKDGRVSNIVRTNGLPDPYVFAMALDDRDDMWVNSSSGIYRVSRSSLEACADGRTNQVSCVLYDSLDAVKTTDTTEVEYSIAKTTDGRIWLPSPIGVIQIDPKNLRTNQVAPPVSIQWGRVNGTEMSPRRPVTVQPGKGEVQIHFVALSFIAPQKIRFRYRLEGYDSDWVNADGRQSAFYTNLKPGRYRFHLQAANADGIWNEHGDSFEFELPPHYYQTAWFRVVLGLLGAGGLAGVYFWRFRHLQRKEQRLRAANERLEARIQERTRELAEQRNLLRTLIDHLPDNVFAKDTQSRMILSNRAHAHSIGAGSPEAAAGKTDFDFFPRELAQKFFADEQALLQTGEPFNGEESSIVQPSGEPRWFRTTKVPLHDADGKIIGLAGINRDITERKQWEARLEAMHRQLLETSRQAGMAEVATSVLHNVGNVLNSVNISAAVVADRVKHSAVGKMELVLAMLHEHRADLARFLTEDEKGRKLLDYLEALNLRLAEEKSALLTEIECLVQNIGHIKEIVAMQQTYARVAGVHEILNPVELVEDALRMQAPSFARHEVQVRREFAPAPSITIDRHKTMQILVNLLQNAKWACEQAPDGGAILVKVHAPTPDRVQIEVTDNGIGIPQENLTRIFAHGFTTRPGGHGFALHSGALAAREMGGALRAESDGPGKGARFILELPCKPSSDTAIFTTNPDAARGRA